MNLSNFGAVRHSLLSAAVLAILAVPVSAQIVEKERTFADLTASHPCNSGLTDRNAIVTDCDAADDIGDGGGAFRCFAHCDGTAPWAAVSIGGGGGGGGVTDGDKGDVAVSGSGATWTVESGTATALASPVVIEGTADAFEGNFTFADPTADWTWAWGAAGDLVGAGSLSVDNLKLDGNAFATITPAATTGATAAGQALAITASPAVASTDTAGAAAGGSVTITAGAAARNTSGNANGGAISIVPGAGIGTGSTGKIQIGTTAPSYDVGIEGKVTIGYPGGTVDGGCTLCVSPLSGVTGNASLTGTGTIWYPSIGLAGVNGNTWVMGMGNVNGGGVAIVTRQDNDLWFGGGATSPAGTAYTRMIMSGTNAGLMVQSGWISTFGKNALTADYTNATATMSNLTALSTTLVAARKYTFRMVLRLSDSVAGEGLKFDFDGGSATATDFGANCQVFDSALLLSSDSTALATDFAIATATGASKVVCDGSFTVNAAGTFIPRAAQNSHSTGTLTVELGSHLLMEDVSFN